MLKSSVTTNTTHNEHILVNQMTRRKREPLYWQGTGVRQEWSFPLIQPVFVKLTKLAQFDKTSHAWQYMELVIVWSTNGTENSGLSGRASDL